MIQINGDRLWKRLMDMAQIGKTPKGGVCRVALTDEDKAGRDLFIQWCKAAGCTIDIDQIGNIFARKEGKNKHLPPIMIGSHLDSQPTGGKFDGVYGVLAGLEILETLNDEGIQLDHPIEIVNWTNEEGARFAPATVASGVFAGIFSLDYAYSRTDKNGITLGDELKRIGYQGATKVGNRNYAASFEIHIEQGPILEAEAKQIGIVTGVQGIRWYDLDIYGKETHAGPSPMSYRIDPVKAAIPILDQIYQLSEKYIPETKITVGYLDTSPGVKNTVPGKLTISLDIRNPDQQVLNYVDNDLKKILTETTFHPEIKTDLKEIWYAPPIQFAPNCINAVKKAAEKLNIPALEMVSGAGHDSAYISKVTPTSMIFIPCKDGLSHNELESAKKEDVEAGGNVLLHAVLEMGNH